MNFAYYSDSFYVSGSGYVHMTINANPGDEMIIITGAGSDILIDPMEDQRLYDEAIEMLGEVTQETMRATAAEIIGRRDRMLSDDLRYYWDADMNYEYDRMGDGPACGEY